MRKIFLSLSVVALSIFFVGCAHVEKTERKFGRGMNNAADIVRGGEFRRSMEQTALHDGPDVAHSTGFIRGINRTLGRTGIGLWEMISAPFSPHDPQFTEHFSPYPVYPDNYQPTLAADPMFATDTHLGFSGGNAFPFLPGNRFHVFNNP
jgi:putative exosortase-associated protein (TIGR04073 family)